MSDLVERLREAAFNIERARYSAIVENLAGWEHRIVRQSANLIESQQATINELVEVLRKLDRRLKQHPDDTPEDDGRDKRKAHAVVVRALSKLKEQSK